MRPAFPQGLAAYPLRRSVSLSLQLRAKSELRIRPLAQPMGGLASVGEFDEARNANRSLGR